MNEITYSIIIPHKNDPDLLNRCLLSIPQRNDIQIIVIDDNSNDREKVINVVANYKQALLVLKNDNKGAGYARNVGLNNVLGKWILFADADDFYNANAFSVLDRYSKSDNDIIYFFANSYDVNTHLVTPREKDLNRIYKNYNPKCLRSSDYIRFKNWVPWNKMIRYEFWKKHGVYFDEIPFGNDLNFSQKQSFLANKYEIIEDKLYCLTYSKNSITYKTRSFELESLTLSLRAQLNIYFRRINRPLWHKYTCVYLLQIAQRKGIRYALGYINYLLKNRKKIRCEIRKNEQLIKDFFIRYFND